MPLRYINEFPSSAQPQDQPSPFQGATGSPNGSPQPEDEQEQRGPVARAEHLEQTEDEAKVSEERFVKALLARIEKAKRRHEKAFKRMKDNAKFATGIQWDGQKDMVDSEERYICNLTLRMVRGKVAQLYARNPQAEAIARKRMVFQLWDGSVEMLTEALMGAQAGDMNSMAVMMDFMHGRQEQDKVKKVCETLKTLYEYEVDQADPEFKEQMKQLVTRVVTCGVGYCIPSYVREGVPPLSTVEVGHSMADRAKRARLILDKIEEEKVMPEDAEMETLKTLFLSMGVSQQNGDEYALPERLEFDFPPATAIIPDEHCRAIKGFIGCREVYHEMCLPLEEVNEFFGLMGEDAVKPSSDLISEQDGESQQVYVGQDARTDPNKKPKVYLYRCWNIRTKTECFVAKGHKKFIVPPSPPYPCVSGFWPVFGLTFNDIEVVDDADISPFPPSDVQLAMDAQKEWNRTRDALRGQRNANAPTYLARKGVLTDKDKLNLKQRVPNEVVELEQVPADKEPMQVVQVLQVAEIDPAVYNTQPLEQDLQLAAGAQQADLGPAQPNVTATVGNIAEQNKMTVTSSNVDDLDCFLSRIAKACGEMLLQSMPQMVVIQIVGEGAVWPEMERAPYLNQIYLTTKAASSGRPNQALETSKYMQIAPILMRAGANPIAVIEEGVRRMDDQLDVQKFFPIPGQAMMTSGPAAKQIGAPSPSTPAAPPAGQPMQPGGVMRPMMGGTPALGPQPEQTPDPMMVGVGGPS